MDVKDGRDAIQLLDFGYVKFIESWGSDERIVEAARMSTQKGFLGWSGEPCPNCSPFTPKCGKCVDGRTVGDEKLLKYLYEHHHDTPFEFAGMVIEVQAPIFVFREWHRHRTQSYNEMSARYEPLPDVNYVPTVERMMINANASNKQAGTVKGAELLTVDAALTFMHELQRSYGEAQKAYTHALAAGVPKELARLVIPVGRYSRMRASTCLRNWLGFLTLRMAPEAQWEIRMYANAVAALISMTFPRTWELFWKARS